MMARSGCRGLYVGLESFNPATLTDMRKHQNVIHKMRAALECCRKSGILIVSGLMVSPLLDSPEDIRNIPESLDRSGLHVPTFIAFESPIPGTPHFHRLGREKHPPAFMPNVLLRDLAGYTLAVRPRKCSADEFVAAYREVTREVFSARRRLAKVARDVPAFLARGHWLPALIDMGDMAMLQPDAYDFPGRTFIAGTDAPPPESVPLTDADFASEAQRRELLEPWRVTDDAGAPLPQWRNSRVVFEPRRPAASESGSPAESVVL
jgi:hypothetical protein